MLKNEKTGFYETPNGARIAYRKLEALARDQKPCDVVFCGGYASNMMGTKAQALAQYCAQNGYGFLRFDYQGHGGSSGEFVDFGIADWIEDTRQIIEHLCANPIILIGSSMGGWVGTYLAREYPEKIAAFIGIAAAPDFSEDSFWAEMNENERMSIERGEIVERPSGYDEPYKISPHLILQGREKLVLRNELNLTMPVRLFQGFEDQSVSTKTALRLANHANCRDLSLHFVKTADHSFSRAQDLELVFGAIEELSPKN